MAAFGEEVDFGRFAIAAYADIAERAEQLLPLHSQQKFRGRFITQPSDHSYLFDRQIAVVIDV